MLGGRLHCAPLVCPLAAQVPGTIRDSLITVLGLETYVNRTEVEVVLILGRPRRRLLDVDALLDHGGPPLDRQVDMVGVPPSVDFHTST